MLVPVDLIECLAGYEESLPTVPDLIGSVNESNEFTSEYRH